MPQQERSRQTVAWILEAAAELFAERGYARATTNRIAARAGVSIGTLYQYFPNKDALVLALLEAHQAEVREVVDECLARLADPDVPLGTALRGLFDDLAALHAVNPSLQRVLGDASRRLPRGRRKTDRYLAALEQVLGEHPEVSVRDPAMAARVVGRTIEAHARWLGHEAPRSLDRRAFVDECVAMLVDYLCNRPA